ncbi:MAG: 30S ribosomal protein S16 [Patescibacteria group bacterium]|jgi:small subunit ribosomal protein S16
MLAIRLARVGTNKKPFYRIILCEKSRDNYGKVLEIFGTYSTFTKDLQVDAEKIKVWIGKGAQPTPTLNNLFLDKKIITDGKKMKSRRANTEKLVKKREETKKKTEDAKIAAEAVKKAEEDVAKAVPVAEVVVPSVSENVAPVAENPVEKA